MEFNIQEIQDFFMNNITIISICVVMLVSIICSYFYFNSNNSTESMASLDNNAPKILTPEKKIEIPPSTENEVTDGKVLNYFGGKRCPHSNLNSMMYKIVFEKMKNKYPDVSINLFWSDEKQEKFKENNVQFVPTLTSGSNTKINAKMENINIDDYNDKELEELFLKNIYDQL